VSSAQGNGVRRKENRKRSSGSREAAICTQHQANGIAMLSGPKILPLTLRRIHGLGGEPVQLAKKIGQDPVPVGDDHVVGVRHHAGRVNHDARALRGERRAVKEDPVGLGAGAQPKRALVAAPGDQIRLARNRCAADWPRDASHCERRIHPDSATFSRILSGLRLPAWHGQFWGWRGHPAQRPSSRFLPSGWVGLSNQVTVLSRFSLPQRRRT